MQNSQKNITTPKLAAVSMIRNEGDILELFIKINARIFDAFYILDHHSSDTTPIIIKKLQEKNYPIIYKRLPDVEFDQAKITTNAVREVANKNLYDFIFPIDGDEFLFFNNDVSIKETIESLLPQTRFGMIPWRTYCPVSPDYLSLDAPLYKNFRMRKHEHVQFYKVVLGNEFAKNCSISMGNHNAKHSQFNTDPILLPFELQHVPIRNNDQLIRKVLLTDHINRLRTNRGIGESFHYDVMAKKIRDQNYMISFDDLFHVAMNYAMPETVKMSNSLDDDAPRIGLDSDVIVFKYLASVNIIKSFDMLLLDMVNRIDSSRNRFMKRKIMIFKSYINKNLPKSLKNVIKKLF